MLEAERQLRRAVLGAKGQVQILSLSFSLVLFFSVLFLYVMVLVV